MESNLLKHQDQLLKAHLGTLNGKEREQFIKQYQNLNNQDKYLVLNEINSQGGIVESDPYMSLAQLGGMLQQYQAGAFVGPTIPDDIDEQMPGFVDNTNTDAPVVIDPATGRYVNSATGAPVVLDGEVAPGISAGNTVAGVVTTDAGTVVPAATALPPTRKRVSNGSNPNIKRSEQVKYLQAALHQQGYTPGNSLIRGSGDDIMDWDGIEGKSTSKALMQYAKENGVDTRTAYDQLIGTIVGSNGRTPMYDYQTGLANTSIDPNYLETYNRNSSGYTDPGDPNVIYPDVPQTPYTQAPIHKEAPIEPTAGPGWLLPAGYAAYRGLSKGMDMWRNRKRRGRTPDAPQQLPAGQNRSVTTTQQPLRPDEILGRPNRFPGREGRPTNQAVTPHQNIPVRGRTIRDQQLPAGRAQLPAGSPQLRNGTGTPRLSANNPIRDSRLKAKVTRANDQIARHGRDGKGNFIATNPNSAAYKNLVQRYGKEAVDLAIRNGIKYREGGYTQYQTGGVVKPTESFYEYQLRKNKK